MMFLRHHSDMPEPFELGNQPIIAFIATLDPERARKFYRDTLGLRLVLDELPFALVFDANGTMLRVTPVKEWNPPGFTVLGWQVPDIAAAAKALGTAGVRFERYPGLEQDELGIWTVPGGGARVAWFKDPDGNTLGISQH
jgi:catechol 2,3-dioxygenase-like lactoylglutathione lyase family enzyme